MIRVLIADDSTLTRVVLRDLLSQDREIEVVCEAGDGRSAVDETARLRPDLVIMDVMMPVMDGLEAVAAIMAETPTPILMLSANTDATDSCSAFAAIKLGALDVMEKPTGVVSEAFSQISYELIKRIKTLSRIRVIHHYHPQPRRPQSSPLVDSTEKRRIVAVGASTGGPKAVMQLLQEFPADLAAAVLVVQHIADGFAPGFADWLNREAAMPVRLAVDGDALLPGQVLIAPNSTHMILRAGRVYLEDSKPLNNCRPAVDALFHSLALDGLAPQTVAVLLTGMGRDGADGLASAHQRGAFTIAQDEESCAVFGMPRVAIERGAATQVLPLEHIAQTVCHLVGS